MQLCFSYDEARAAFRLNPKAALLLVLPADSSDLSPDLLTKEEKAGFSAISHAVQRLERSKRRQALRALLSVAGLAQGDLGRGPAGEVTTKTLYLSSSSRNNIVAAAFGPAPLGIDVELALGAGDVPWAVLHPDEANHIRNGVNGGALWAAKEAVWKACRMPLSRDPASYSVLPNSQGHFEAEKTKGFVRWHPPLSCYIASAITQS